MDFCLSTVRATCEICSNLLNVSFQHYLKVGFFLFFVLLHFPMSKIKIKSDGQQFNQYQQNKQSPHMYVYVIVRTCYMCMCSVYVIRFLVHIVNICVHPLLIIKHISHSLGSNDFQ